MHSWKSNGLKEETIREFRKYYEMNKNSNTKYQNLQNATRAVLTRTVQTQMSTLKKEIANQQPNLPLEDSGGKN